jgi:ABC-type Fe3+/spermidine/putrescine transport system ATPase subunit
MADRMAVLKDGKLLQCDAPHEIYERPADRFVADFIGVMNFFEGKVVEGGVEAARGRVISGRPPDGAKLGAAATAAVRPERIRLAPPSEFTNRFSGRVEAVVYHGLDLQVSVLTDLSQKPLLVRLTSADADRWRLAAGDSVEIGWSPDDTRIFLD